MIKLTNRTQGPISVLIRSRNKIRAFDTLIIPGRGANKNIKVIEDELYTDYIGRMEKLNLISVQTINK